MFEHVRFMKHLATATTAGALATSAIRGEGSHILDTADLEASASEGTDGRLGTGASRAGTDTTGTADLDVDGSDAELLEASGNILGSHHSGVGGGLITASLDLHATGNTGKGLLPGHIGHVNEGIVVRGVQVAHSHGLLILTNGRLHDLLC